MKYTMNSLFCDDILNNILSYMSYQDKAKSLASGVLVASHGLNLNINVLEKVKVCCNRCSFDNVAIQFNICTYCIISLDLLERFRFLTYEDCNKFYKFNSRKLDETALSTLDLKLVSYPDCNIILYDRLAVESYVQKQFSSKQNRLDVLYEKDLKKAKAVKSKENLEIKRKAEQQRLSLEFSSNNYQDFFTYYFTKIRRIKPQSATGDKRKKLIEKAMDALIIKCSKDKQEYAYVQNKAKLFIKLRDKFASMNMKVRTDSYQIDRFMDTDFESDNIVDSELEELSHKMYELHYLHSKTKYARSLTKAIQRERNQYGYGDVDVEQVAINTRADFFVKQMYEIKLAIQNTSDNLNEYPVVWINLLKANEQASGEELKKIYVNKFYNSHYDIDYDSDY